MPAYKLQGRTTFQGLSISIENRKGSVRRWYDPHGKEKGSTKMHFAYGYIRRTEGTDGDHVDVYIGPQADASHAFIVDQMKKPEGDIKKDGKPWTKFDEQKVMLGFPSAAAAKAAYLKQYDDPRFFGTMKAMPMSEFIKKVLDKKSHGKKVAADEILVDAFLKRAEVFLDIDNPGDPLHVPPTERRRRKKVANGDMLQYFADHPQKLKERLERIKAKEKKASPNLEASNEFTRHGSTGGAAEKQTDRENRKKVASRQEHIAERVDDVGIGILAAPYAADVVAKLKGRKGAVGAVGRGAEAAGKWMHKHETPLELTGLALVAPAITNTVARGITKATEKKSSLTSEQYAQLEKIAEEYIPDFEYMTEAEKRANVAFLGRMAGGLLRGAGRVVSHLGGARAGSKLVGKGNAAQRLGRIKAKGLAPGTVEHLGSSQVRKLAIPPPAPGTAGRVQHLEGRLARMQGKKPPVPAATPGGAPAKGGMRPGTKALLLGSGLAVGGGALYTGKKVVDAGASLASQHHERPWGWAPVHGQGRVF